MQLTKKHSGYLVVSLDLELMWGMRDHRTIKTYGDAVLGGREAIPHILRLFDAYGVRATWATVGLLFFDNRNQVLKHLPEKLPEYHNRRLSPYDDLENIGPNERADPYHFGRSLIGMIAETPGQEIGTHTFSHYYCLEDGQTASAFQADMEAAADAARDCGIQLQSIVFPRNQWTKESIDICREIGISTYRGNPEAAIYRPMSRSRNKLHVRAMRLADSLVDTGARTSHVLETSENGVYDIRASRFLRPSMPMAIGHDHLRLRRILNEMEEAARNKKLYHLWWHPHNFGRNTARNLVDLESILRHFRKLSESYDMQAAHMADIGEMGLSA